MKRSIIGLLFSAISGMACADSVKPQLYLNQNLGFNIKGFNYQQAQFPCDIDQQLMLGILKQGKDRGLSIEPVGTADKIFNGEIPVLAIDVEELVLNKEFRYGSKAKSNLPRVKVTAALIRGKEGKDVVMAKHSCAIATLNEFTPSSNVMDMGTAATVCSATRKCLNELSKDVVQWVAPQVK